jgi:hypothetical protein
VKAFSPAGMAVKGFFGYGARTLGNPDGALKGGGAYAAGGASPFGPDQGGGGAVIPAIAWTAHPKFIDESGIVAMGYGDDIANGISYMLISANDDTSGLGFAYVSADGVNWTKKSQLPAGIWFASGGHAGPNPALIFNNGAWIVAAIDSQPGIGAENSSVALSTDAGATWSVQETGIPGILQSSALAGNGGAELILICENQGNNNYVATSLDSGATWTVSAPFPNGSVAGSFFFDGSSHFTFIGLEEATLNAAVATLEEGESIWTYNSNDSGNVTFFNGGQFKGSFVAAGPLAPGFTSIGVFTSALVADLPTAGGAPTPDPPNQANPNPLAMIATADNLFVLANDGATSNVWNSPDGINWSPASHLVPTGSSVIAGTAFAYNPVNAHVLVGDLFSGIVSFAVS